MEIEVQEDFLSFDADLVAEQLTYMDAVSGGVGLAWQRVLVLEEGNRLRRLHLRSDVILTSACSSAPAAV